MQIDVIINTHGTIKQEETWNFQFQHLQLFLWLYRR